MKVPDLTKIDEWKLAAIPLLLVLLSVATLGYGYVTTGEPIELGMDFKGGTSITVSTAEDASVVGAEFSEFGITDVRETPGRVVLHFGPMSPSRKQELLDQVREEYPDFENNYVEPSFGETLQRQALVATGMAFAAMSVIVLLLFRRLLPAGTIVLAASGDMFIAAASMQVLDMQLSLATVAALLMLIGYSVDSNILLTTRMLKRRGTISKRFRGALRTGVTMAVTTLSAIGALAVISYAAPGMTILFEIGVVLLAGLVADFLNTWFLNGSVLRRTLRREGVEVR